MAHRRLLTRVAACILFAAAVLIIVWRSGVTASGPASDTELEERARRIQSEIQDYAPPETNVPSTAEPGSPRQARPTRQPQRAD